MQNLQATRPPILYSVRDSLQKFLALHHPHCLWFWKMSDTKYFKHPKCLNTENNGPQVLPHQGNKCLPLACQMCCSISSIPVHATGAISQHYTEPASPTLWPHTCPFIPSPASEVSKQLSSHYTGRLGPTSHTKAKPVSIGHVHPDSFSSECLDTCPPGSHLPPVSTSHSCCTGPEASSLHSPLPALPLGVTDHVP